MIILNGLKAFGNGLGIVLSSLLSVVLVVLLLAAPFVSAVCSFTQPDTIHKVIKDIDFVEIVAQHEELQLTLAQYGIDGHFLDGVTETELMEKLVEAYVQSIFEGKKFDPHVVEDIIVAYKDDAITLFRRLAEEKGSNIANLSDEEFFSQILNAVRTEWEKITSVLPSAEDMGITQAHYDQWASAARDKLPLQAPKKLGEASALIDTVESGVKTVGDILFYIRSGAPVRIVLTVIVVFSVLILACRWPRFKGCMWLCVLYFLSALLDFAISGAMTGLAAARDGVTGLLISPVISVFAGELTKYGIFLVVIGAVMLVVFILGRVILSSVKKNGSNTEETDADEPVEMPAEAEEDSTAELLKRVEVFEDP